jgi:hypothetical protein
MKILLKTDTKVITLTYADNVDIIAHAESGMFRVTENGVTEPVFGVDSLSLVEDVTLPDDYEKAKYIYTSNGFEINPNWSNIQAQRAMIADPRLTNDPLYEQPFSSWVWNSTAKQWDPPVTRPEDFGKIDYDWDEDNQGWVKK